MAVAVHYSTSLTPLPPKQDPGQVLHSLNHCCLLKQPKQQKPPADREQYPQTLIDNSVIPETEIHHVLNSLPSSYRSFLKLWEKGNFNIRPTFFLKINCLSIFWFSCPRGKVTGKQHLCGILLPSITALCGHQTPPLSLLKNRISELENTRLDKRALSKSSFNTWEIGTQVKGLVQPLISGRARITSGSPTFTFLCS